MIKPVFLCLSLFYGSAIAAICPNGAEVDTVARCKYFVQYAKQSVGTDLRITERLGAQGNRGVRSIALIVGIDSYPNLPAPKKTLAPARIDVDNLRNFFKSDQKFDEVIVLRNGEATKENIEYFLSQYVPQVGLEMRKKARFVFAYSGHGIDKTNTSKAVFLLSNAKSPDDLANSYRMTDLRDRLSTLANNYFHVLALINACYGGNVFEQGAGGFSLKTTEQPGAYAMTASSDNNTAASLGGNSGSIFFDSLIAGIKSGAADREYLRIMDADGKLQQQGGIVRLGALNNYLDTEFEIINRQHDLHLDKTWIGPIQNDHQRGGFFFLSPVTVTNGRSVIHIPPGPRSSVPGRPDLKIFSAKEDYPIRGIDVSRYEGAINWDKVIKKNADLRFVYIRASGWSGEDSSFKRHWQEAKQVGLDRGAYHVFDYCSTPQQQLELIERVVPKDASSLPIALDLEFLSPLSPISKREYACHDSMGKAKLQESVLKLAALLRERYGKVPLIYGNRSFLNTLLDDRFNQYMIWLAVYAKSSKPTTADLALRGSNPWTLWQYTGSRTVTGIGNDVDGNAFFGGEAEYKKFQAGAGNIALAAARGN